MIKKYLTDIADYSNWADTAVISWLEEISDEQWEKETESSFNSIAKTTLHIISAKRIWIDFWNNVRHPTFLSIEFTGNKTDLIEIWKKTMVQYKNFIEDYNEENYSQKISITIKDEKWEMEFAETVLHQNNHATFHRGQLVTMLRQVGFTNFTNTDIASYVVKHKNRK
ncbi:DinB family protein [Chryseobacterium indoltheticum]|uniref:DinB family protein n=1 Tax=Chryseobacterium indoltheticum TaxID=254 RepID=UPI0019116DAB|nr:DinB family protein [Chryseobacterium indoltheticum]QQQ28926.1 DinB family protein [Chryseobacterium indoltheticum]